MPKQLSIKSRGIAALALAPALGLALALTAAPAYAGFEWITPPPSAPAPASSPSVSVYPLNAPVTSAPLGDTGAATGAPEDISPLIITGTPSPDESGAGAEGAPTSVISTAPVSRYRRAHRAPQSLATATIALPSNQIVQGFASQIPLALALRQILPVGYNFSIDQNVNMNTLVSYKGGKSWRDTLDDMLAPIGLVAHAHGATITVSRAQAPESEPAVTPAAVPALQPAPQYQYAPSNYAQPSYTQPSYAQPVVQASSGGWGAERGETLRKVLAAWCQRAGVQLQWQAEYDYPMEASVDFRGSFEDAVRSLLTGFESARPQPFAELHNNPAAGQRLLIVRTRGNSYSN
ncbi:MAG: TcpQ domain-containing protein [Alphaproteobacteria bacterium]|nr:TcpQ domain-containing protein [Alphaproteobacteria bacterium]